MGPAATPLRRNTPEFRKRRCRWLRCTVLILVTVMPLLYFAPSIVLRSPLRNRLLRKLLPDSTAQIHVADISGGWRTPIELRDVRYSTSGIEFLAESIQCDRTLLQLLCDSENLGSISVQAPRLSLLPRDEVVAERDDIHAVASHSGRSTASRRAPTAPRPIRAATSARIHLTDGILYIANSPSDRTCVARTVTIDLNGATDSDHATFRVLARVGDLRATAHVSAHGALRWPCHSLPADLLESRVELVGVDAEWAERLLAAAGLFRKNAERINDTTPAAWRGSVTGSVDIRGLDRESFELRANFEVQDFGVSEPAAGLELYEPTVSINVLARLTGDEAKLTAGRISICGLTIDAAGVIRDLAGEARAELNGSLWCDWQKLAPRLRHIFPEEIQITGAGRRPWRLTGSLRGDSRRNAPRSIELDAAVYVESLRVGNFEFGPTELAARYQDESLRFEPITCAFQGGQVRLLPRIRFHDGMPVLQLDAGRVIDHVALDPRLCDWILRFVDPLATISRDLQGHLSLDIDELQVPLTQDGLALGSALGRLQLEAVQLSPEDSLREILTMAGIALQHSSVRTSQRIEIRLSDGRVHHTGLAVPIGDDQVTLDGWVGLDHTVNIRVSLPVTEELLGNDKRLYRLLRGQRIDIPVTGTLVEPKVSETVLARNIQRLVQSALRDKLGDDPLRGLLRRALK